MKITRRGVLAGALAAPAVAGLPRLVWAAEGNVVLVHDLSLEAGRSLAALHGGEALAIEGDRIRFARALFARRPSLVVGVSRHADALLIEDVGREAGYTPTEDAKVRQVIAAAQPLDRGLVLAWVLALQ